jgi:hypothetical protein
MRRWVIGIVVSNIVLGLGVGGFYLKGKVVEAPSPPSEPVALALPLAPLPEALAWVGEPGTDADGYPRSSPSALSLVALLRHRQFERLTREMETLERAAADDPKKEYWATDAAEAFAFPIRRWPRCSTPGSSDSPNPPPHTPRAAPIVWTSAGTTAAPEYRSRRRKLVSRSWRTPSRWLVPTSSAPSR